MESRENLGCLSCSCVHKRMSPKFGCGFVVHKESPPPVGGGAATETPGAESVKESSKGVGGWESPNSSGATGPKLAKSAKMESCSARVKRVTEFYCSSYNKTPPGNLAVYPCADSLVALLPSSLMLDTVH